VLVWASRFQLARVSAALAVAAILAGWAAAQRPTVLPGLTLHQAAAGRATLIAVIVAVLAGGVILAPSLGLLVRLMLTGGFDPGSRPARQSAGGPTSARSDAHTGTSARLAVACLLAGFVLLTVVEAGVAHVAARRVGDPIMTGATTIRPLRAVSTLRPAPRRDT
jgi:cytochrome d ubiquinol oxidase subunit II